MNTNEQKMLQILKELKENYNVLSVKAEFEAEGTRTDDLLRLCDLVRRSGLSLTIKIGGRFGRFLIFSIIDGPFAKSGLLLIPIHIALRALEALILLAGTVTILFNGVSFEIERK